MSVNGYVLDSVDGSTYIVIKCEDKYWANKVIKKLQKMRERDLKELFIQLEEDMNGRNT